MELSGEFFVNAGVDEAWRILTDLERVAPCIPGAELREVEGGQYRGVLRVTAGEVSAEYKGAVSLVESDAKGRRAVLHVEGRETRGKGSARAAITAVLSAAGDRTKVSLTGEATVSGKLGQLSESALADVVADVVAGFSDNLQRLEAPVKRPGRQGRAAARREQQAPAAPTAETSDLVEEAAGAKPARGAATRPGPVPVDGGSNGSAGHAQSHNGKGARDKPEAGVPADTIDEVLEGVGAGDPDAEAGAVSENGATTDFEAAMDEVGESEGRSGLAIRIAAIAGGATVVALIAAWLRRRLR